MHRDKIESIELRNRFELILLPEINSNIVYYRKTLEI